jgi:hypothetical protein
MKFKTKKLSMDIIGFYVIDGGMGDMAKYVISTLQIPAPKDLLLRHLRNAERKNYYAHQMLKFPYSGRELYQMCRLKTI